MTADTDAYADALAAADVAVTRTSVANAPDAILAAATNPTVAVDLPVPTDALTAAGVTVDPTPEQLRAARTGVTAGALGITSYGSVVLRCTGDGSEFLALYPDRHVAVVAASDVRPDMSDAIDAVADPMRAESADFVVATGPSATADMGAVVQGVHGPSEVHVVLLEDR